MIWFDDEKCEEKQHFFDKLSFVLLVVKIVEEKDKHRFCCHVGLCGSLMVGSWRKRFCEFLRTWEISQSTPKAWKLLGNHSPNSRTAPQQIFVCHRCYDIPVHPNNTYESWGKADEKLKEKFRLRYDQNLSQQCQKWMRTFMEKLLTQLNIRWKIFVTFKRLTFGDGRRPISLGKTRKLFVAGGMCFPSKF